MLKQFREDEPALQALANFAADTGNIELARRTYEEALENEFALYVFALLLIEAHLVNSDYTGALEFAEELLKEKPQWLTQRWAIFHSLRAVASYGINRPDIGEIYLQNFIDDKSNQPQTYLAVARRFTNIERYQQAQKILSIAYTQALQNLSTGNHGANQHNCIISTSNRLIDQPTLVVQLLDIPGSTSLTSSLNTADWIIFLLFSPAAMSSKLMTALTFSLSFFTSLMLTSASIRAITTCLSMSSNTCQRDIIEHVEDNPTTHDFCPKKPSPTNLICLRLACVSRIQKYSILKHVT